MRCTLYRIPVTTLEIKIMNDYTANGFANRREYLESLCEEYDRETVYAIASILGPSEDFDGLITHLEDAIEY